MKAYLVDSITTSGNNIAIRGINGCDKASAVLTHAEVQSILYELVASTSNQGITLRKDGQKFVFLQDHHSALTNALW